MSVLFQHILRCGLVLLAGSAAYGCASDGDPLPGPGSIALSLSEPSATVQQGGSQPVTATLTRAGGFSGTVDLTVTGAPSGVTASVSNLQTTGAVTSATVTIVVAPGVAPAVYPLVVHGTGSGVSEVTQAFTLTVTAPPAEPGYPELALDKLATGMSHPLYLTAPPGDRSRLFVVERTGAIRIIKHGVLEATPFLDITARVSTGAEQGILGMAFPPDYATSRYFVVYYVNPAAETVLSRFHVGSATSDIALSGEEALLTIPQPGGDHNGGMLAYGQDGYLYLSVGDGGCCGDPNGHGQDRTELLGSILRLNVGSTGPYQIPATNPWANDGMFRHELWNYGLRNPFRFSFDRQTGDMYIGDVGDENREEIDVLPRTSVGGENLGWRIMEGKECFGGGTSCNMNGLTLPVWDYSHSQGCSVIGGFVYRGVAIPALRGTYFYLDFCAAWIETFRWAGGAASSWRRYLWLDSSEFPNSFGEDADGELYITSESGNVFKVVAKTP
jgi:glucose/arabinose dehydrogenase